MNLFPLGNVTVTTAGTPVALTANPNIRATKIVFTQATGNAAVKVLYDGVVLFQLAAAPATGMLDKQCVCAPQARWLELSRFSVDAATNGQGPFVYYLES